MSFMVSTATIDVITRAAFKYKLVTRGTCDMLGAELIRLNALACIEAGVTQTADGEPFGVPVVATYTRTPFARKVKRLAIDGAVRCWLEQVAASEIVTTSPAFKLVQRIKMKNDQQLGLVTYGPDVYDEYGEYLSRGERIVAEPEAHDFWDIVDTEEGREACMIRSREVRQAEQRAILEARMAEREAERETAARRQAVDLDESYDDEDEWDDDDE